MSELVKADIAGRAVGLSGAKLRQLASEGKVPCVRLNARVIRFSIPDVIAALAAASTARATQAGGKVQGAK